MELASVDIQDAVSDLLNRDVVATVHVHRHPSS
jgi:hypothetical protein